MSAAARLGLPADASAADVEGAAKAALNRFRKLGENPLTDRATADLCRTVVRSCEAILAAPDRSAGAGSDLPARVALFPEPAIGAGEDTHDERQTG